MVWQFPPMHRSPLRPLPLENSHGPHLSSLVLHFLLQCLQSPLSVIFLCILPPMGHASSPVQHQALVLGRAGMPLPGYMYLVLSSGPGSRSWITPLNRVSGQFSCFKIQWGYFDSESLLLFHHRRLQCNRTPNCCGVRRASTFEADKLSLVLSSEIKLKIFCVFPYFHSNTEIINNQYSMSNNPSGLTLLKQSVWLC